MWGASTSSEGAGSRHGNPNSNGDSQLATGQPGVEVSQNLLMEDFKCPICLDFVITPVYSCTNGHLVCGSCYIGLAAAKKCQLCQVKLSSNQALDRILTGDWVKIPCRNLDYGCSLKFSPAQVKEHLKECDYRGIKCSSWANVRCDGRTYSPGELVEHWKTTHKIYKVNGKVVEDDRFRVFYECNVKAIPANETSAERPTSTKYFEYDGRSFFVHFRFMNDLIHWWMTCAATESEIKASNYRFVSSIGRSSKKSLQDMAVMTPIPVHSLHFSDVDTVKKSGHVVVMYASTIVDLFKDKTSGECNFAIRFDLMMNTELASKKMKF